MTFGRVLECGQAILGRRRVRCRRVRRGRRGPASSGRPSSSTKLRGCGSAAPAVAGARWSRRSRSTISSTCAGDEPGGADCRLGDWRDAGLEAVAEWPVDRFGESNMRGCRSRLRRVAGSGSWRRTVNAPPLETAVSHSSAPSAIQRRDRRRARVRAASAARPGRRAVDRLRRRADGRGGAAGVRATSRSFRWTGRCTARSSRRWPLLYGANDIDGVAAVDRPELGPRRSPVEDIARQIRAAAGACRSSATGATSAGREAAAAAGRGQLPERPAAGLRSRRAARAAPAIRRAVRMRAPARRPARSTSAWCRRSRISIGRAIGSCPACASGRTGPVARWRSFARRPLPDVRIDRARHVVADVGRARPDPVRTASSGSRRRSSRTRRIWRRCWRSRDAALLIGDAGAVRRSRGARRATKSDLGARLDRADGPAVRLGILVGPCRRCRTRDGARCSQAGCRGGHGARGRRSRDATAPATSGASSGSAARYLRDEPGVSADAACARGAARRTTTRRRARRWSAARRVRSFF